MVSYVILILILIFIIITTSDTSERTYNYFTLYKGSRLINLSMI